MATINAVSVSSLTGTQVPLNTAASGDVIAFGNNRRMWLFLHNSSGAAATVTLTVPGQTWNGHDFPDTAVSVPAGALVVLPLESTRYADDDGQCPVTYSTTTGIRLAAATV